MGVRSHETLAPPTPTLPHEGGEGEKGAERTRAQWGPPLNGCTQAKSRPAGASHRTPAAATRAQACDGSSLAFGAPAETGTPTSLALTPALSQGEREKEGGKTQRLPSEIPLMSHACEP